jgi:glycosyltransferase involved in cell wall biosynthesis
LYIYQYHGDNVFDNQHFRKIIEQSKLIQENRGKEYESYQAFLNKYGESSISNVNSQLNNFQVNLNIYQILSNERPVFILNTYGSNEPDEGLSVVFHQIKTLGLLVNDTSLIQNSTVIIAGICHMYTNYLNPNNTNIIYTTYEFYPLPNLWIKCLNQYYDIIIVPHPKIKELFEISEVKKPIHVVQQGYPKRIQLPKLKSSNFNIGFLGVPAKRKNVDLLINAIQSLSKKIPNIVLKIHISKYYSELTKIDFPETSHFQPTYGYMSEEDLSKWYASLDCYIFPSSGEGWSFTPRESLSLEIPTIISNCLVHQDLKQYSKIIDLQVTVKKIKNSIKIAYEHLEEYQELAKKGKKYVEKYNKNKEMLTSIKKILELYFIN